MILAFFNARLVVFWQGLGTVYFQLPLKMKLLICILIHSIIYKMFTLNTA